MSLRNILRISSQQVVWEVERNLGAPGVMTPSTNPTMRCCTIALTTLRHSKSIFRTTMRWRALEVVPDVSGRRTNGSRSLARWSNSGTGCFSSQILTTFLDLAPAATIIFVLRDNSTLWFGTSPTRVDFKAREFLFS